MPKLSIITVNLNNKAGLIDTAESVVAQTWTDYEWLIIDGGSTDGSVDVIKEYADKTDKLVYWCSEPDGGIYQGMNKGIEKAGGEYCWFLNSGDYAYKNTTLAEVFANEFDEDIVYGDIMRYTNGVDGNYYEKSKHKEKLSLEYCFYNPVPQHQATLIKRELFNKYGKYQTVFRIIADRVFFNNVLFIENVPYKYISVAFSVVENLLGCSSISSNKVIIKNERKKMMALLFPRNYRKVIVKAYFFYKMLYIPLVFKNILNKIFTLGIRKTALYYLETHVRIKKQEKYL